MTDETPARDLPIGALMTGWHPPERPSDAPMAGRYCRLERLSARHAADLHEANCLDPDGRMWTYLPYGPFESQTAYGAWIDSYCMAADPMFFAIVDLTTGKAVGVASYLRIDPANGCIEVGHLAFSPKLQRTPAATEAMFLMMERVYDAGYRRYEWKCNALNAPSRASAMRLGFSFEGVFRQATIAKGRTRDTAWYASIDAEWPALKVAFQTWLAPANFDARGAQRVSLRTLTGPILVKQG